MTDYEREFCARCDHYRGYVCAEHRKPSYESLTQRLAAAEAELDEVKRILSIGVGRDEQTLAFIIDKQRTRIVELLEAAKEVGCEH